MDEDGQFTYSKPEPEPQEGQPQQEGRLKKTLCRNKY